MVIFMVQGQDIRHPGQIERPEHSYMPHGVLFLCVRNAARSQMAEGWARQLLPVGVRIWSAGSDPAPVVNPNAVHAMREVGIDISRQYPKRISDVALGDVDTVITLCSEEICVTLPTGIRSTTWDYPDPTKARGSEEEILDAFRRIRDDLKLRVEGLAARPDVAASRSTSQSR
jgi:arsenate reductase